MLVSLSAEHSAVMKGKIMCWPMFLFSCFFMLVKLGAEQFALVQGREMFGPF